MMRNAQLDTEEKERLKVENNLWLRIRHHGPLGVIVWLFLTLFRGMSYAVHVFVRRDIGISNFTFVTGLAAYFWVRLFTFGDFTFQPLEDGYQVFASDNTDTSGMKIDTALQTVYEGVNYVSQFGEDISNTFQALEPIPKGGSQFTFIYSLILPLLFWFNWFSVFIKGNVNRLQRGESVFFGWMYPKDKDTSIRRTVLMFLDPLFPALLGVAIYFLTDEKGFGVMLFFSALAFFTREYAYYISRIKKGNTY